MGYEAIEIGAGAWRIEDNVVRFFLFEGETSALLIDTGFGTGDVKAFVRDLTNLPLMLVNTHADEDHIGGNAAFETVYLHPSEFSTYAKQAKHSGQTVLPLWDGDIIELGGRRFEIILIPGHTPGSIALLDRENRVIITGDTVSDGPVFLFDDRRSAPAIIASLKKLTGMSDAYDKVYASHGGFPLAPEAVAAQLETAEKLLAGELSPQEPPFDLPAKMYVYGSASFFY